MTRKPKWYNRWWVRIVFVAALIIALYFGGRKTVTYFNYQQYQKTVIDSLLKQSIAKDTVIARISKEKQKIKIVRQSISTKAEEDRLKIIEYKLKELEGRKVVVDSLSAAELDKWLRNFLK